MEKLKNRIPDNLAALSREELISLLETIRRDTDVNKSVETPIKVEGTITKSDANPVKSDENLPIKVEDSIIKTDSNTVKAKENLHIKVENNIIKTDANPVKANEKLPIKAQDNIIKTHSNPVKASENLPIKVQDNVIKTDANAVKAYENLPIKVQDNIIKTDTNPVKANENLPIKVQDSIIKTDAISVKTKENLHIKVQDNIIKTDANSVKADENLPIKRKKLKKSEKKKSAIFEFCKYKKRHVVLKFLYIGWDYGGFATQKHTTKTIEEQLFIALMKTKLIENRESCNYHRCGRTDKGVSAFSQVISIDLRSNVHEGKGVIDPDDYIDIGKREDELDFPAILNRVLPPEIRVIAWAPVEVDFSARFNCTQRVYKYWFPIGDLDIKKMLEAGQKLVGEHDFRNFCKMDVANGVLNYRRKIFSVDIKQLFLNTVDQYDIAELTVVGQAFLYHQIRSIVSILCLIGLGKEDPSVVDDLLDVKNYPRKPQYSIASEIPLVLFDCSYDVDLEWNYNEESLRKIIEELQKMWSEFTVKSVIVKNMLKELEELPSITIPVRSQAKFLQPKFQPKTYKKLSDRPCCDSLEETIEKCIKKQKLCRELTEYNKM